MITEYIKRNQRMGYDENGNLVYKIPVDEVYTAEEAELELDLELEVDEESEAD